MGGEAEESGDHQITKSPSMIGSFCRAEVLAQGSK
jgi:hypothetical protein